jgi:hypothetical protein
VGGCGHANPTPEVVARHVLGIEPSPPAGFFEPLPITDTPEFLTASADFVAWYDARHNLVMRVATAGCGDHFPEVAHAPFISPSTNGTSVTPIAGLALDGHDLYIAVHDTGFVLDAGVANRTGIYRCPVDDCTPANMVRISQASAYFLAADAQFLYMYESIYAQLSYCPKSDCSQLTQTSERQTVPGNPMLSLVVDDQSIYVAGYNGYSMSGYMCQCTKPDCASCDWQPLGAYVVASDNTFLYSGGSRTMRLSGTSDGGTMPVTDAGVQGFSTGTSVALAGGFAYWFATEDASARTLVLVRTPTN